MPIAGCLMSLLVKIVSFQSAGLRTSTRSLTSIGVLSARVPSGTRAIDTTIRGAWTHLRAVTVMTQTVDASSKAIAVAAKTQRLPSQGIGRTTSAETKILGLPNGSLLQEMIPPVDANLKTIAAASKPPQLPSQGIGPTTRAERKTLGAPSRSLYREMIPIEDASLKVIAVVVMQRRLSRGILPAPSAGMRILVVTSR